MRWPRRSSVGRSSPVSGWRCTTGVSAQAQLLPGSRSRGAVCGQPRTCGRAAGLGGRGSRPAHDGNAGECSAGCSPVPVWCRVTLETGGGGGVHPASSLKATQSPRTASERERCVQPLCVSLFITQLKPSPVASAAAARLSCWRLNSICGSSRGKKAETGSETDCIVFSFVGRA